MTPRPIRLKYLLQQQHWQTHRTFCQQYDLAAVAIDPKLKGTWPSRAQLHRWLVGELKGLPYPDHCRILEKMFPGWSATQLFEVPSAEEAKALSVGPGFGPDAAGESTSGNDPDVAIFVDLNQEDNRTIAHRIRTAKEIFFAAHTGYNAMVSQYQAAIRDAVRNGCRLRVVITNPSGPLLAQRELTRRLCPSIRQEGEIKDVIATVKRHRSFAVEAGYPEGNVDVKVYNGIVTMNALSVDGWLRVIPYLPLVDAAECPVFEFEYNCESPSPVIAKYLMSINNLWQDSRNVLES